MRFFKLATGLVVLVQLAACVSGVIPVSHPAPEEPEVVATADESEAITTPSPAIVPDISPYFSRAEAVPEKLQTEFALVLARQAQGLYTQALSDWQRLGEQYPAYSGIWLNKGLVERALTQDEQALASFSKAIEVNPLNQDAYNELAILKREQGQFEQAKSLYLEAIAVWPKHARSHKNLAILYELYLHDYGAAMHHYSLYAQYAITLSEQQQRELRGWMIDLERRLRQ